VQLVKNQSLTFFTSCRISGPVLGRRSSVRYKTHRLPDTRLPPTAGQSACQGEKYVSDTLTRRFSDVFIIYSRKKAPSLAWAIRCEIRL
jgi:hypothetical protein